MADGTNKPVVFFDPSIDGKDGSNGNQNGAIDPDFARTASAGNNPADGTRTKRKYTKRQGTGTATAAQKPPLSVDAVSHILLSCHALLAGISKIPELAIDPMEAKLLGQGIVDVAKFYPVAMDPKTLAWINLTMICGTVYGTRVYAIAAKQARRDKAASANEQPEPMPDNVSVFVAGKPN